MEIPQISWKLKVALPSESLHSISKNGYGQSIPPMQVTFNLRNNLIVPVERCDYTDSKVRDQCYPCITYQVRFSILLFCIPHHICRAVCLELQPRPDSAYFCDSHDNSCHGMVPSSCSGFISIICILAIKHFASGIH